ncbi:protein SrpA [Pseudomonas fragi]|uniref:Protein SrpA n=1 Tax=Pseudomonas fragi TaxID=296 RepID=A0A449IGF5_PSEFR|nr:protein SrpA [Pseudomonas fragi]
MLRRGCLPRRYSVPGRTPVVGRFALPSGNPYAPDSSVPIRSFALRFTQANGQQWRTGMNSMPVFPVGTPEAFYQMRKPVPQKRPRASLRPGAMPAFFCRATRKRRPFCNGSKPRNPRPAMPPRAITGSMRFIWSTQPGSGRRCAGVWCRWGRTRRVLRRPTMPIIWSRIWINAWRRGL